MAQVAIGHLLPFGPTATGAATVEAGHHIALLGQHTEPVVVAPAIGVGNLLVAGTAIDVEEERILLAAVEVGGLDDVVV